MSDSSSPDFLVEPIKIGEKNYIMTILKKPGQMIEIREFSLSGQGVMNQLASQISNLNNQTQKIDILASFLEMKVPRGKNYVI